MAASKSIALLYLLLFPKCLCCGNMGMTHKHTTAPPASVCQIVFKNTGHQSKTVLKLVVDLEKKPPSSKLIFSMLGSKGNISLCVIFYNCVLFLTVLSLGTSGMFVCFLWMQVSHINI